MSYEKAHPFGYKAKNTKSKEDMALSHNNIPLSHKQTITEEVSFKVMRRQMVWERDPATGKMKMKPVPVTETKKVNGKKVEVPVYDTFTHVETRVVCHYGREVKGRTLAMMVYETFPKPEMK